MSKYGSSIAEARPELVAEWSPRNTESVYSVRPGSSRKFWWQGACGHEWEAPADNRVYNRTGCPFCTTRGWKKVLPGVNDLATRFPEVAKQWHPTRNGDLSPQTTLPGVKKRVWWLCDDCGREWEALLNMRTSRGTGCPSCRGRKRGVKMSGTKHLAHLYDEWSAQNNLPLSEFSVSSRHLGVWECRNGHIWNAAIGDRNAKATGCKRCGAGGTSKPEIELREFVESLGLIVRPHHRQIHPDYEYDIVVPDRKIAIEFNGLYWHSERSKPRDYHRDKSRAAESAGYQLIHVWEDDWRDRRGVVERMLARKLGVSTEERVNARDLEKVSVSAQEAREFLDANHIQGYAPGSVRVGLRDGQGLVAVMTFRSRGQSWELSRYATSKIVRGGFSRLFKEGVRASGAERVVTFSDSQVSSGDLYLRQGFSFDGVLEPDYSYRVGPRREHKFNYRKKRFREDPNLEYREGLTERELAELNGLDRIYDAGKVRWVWRR